MTGWTHYSLAAMTANAEHLASSSNELQVLVRQLASDMPPDQALLLLGEINGFADSMTHLCEMVKAHALLLKPRDN